MKYFSGRLNRGQHIKAIILSIVVFFGLPYLAIFPISWIMKSLQLPEAAIGDSVIVIFFGAMIAVIFAVCALHIRRLHDLNRSGKDLIYMFVPIANLFFAYMIWFSAGSEGENKYGTQEALTNLELLGFRKEP